VSTYTRSCVTVPAVAVVVVLNAMATPAVVLPFVVCTVWFPKTYAGAGGGVLPTFTETDDVAVLPPRSRATAMIVCEPSTTVVESQLTE
jgi:hypothetical protein